MFEENGKIKQNSPPPISQGPFCCGVNPTAMSMGQRYISQCEHIYARVAMEHIVKIKNTMNMNTLYVLLIWKFKSLLEIEEG